MLCAVALLVLCIWYKKTKLLKLLKYTNQRTQ